MNLWVRTAIRLLISVPLLALIVLWVIRSGPTIGRTGLMFMGGTLIAACVGAFFLEKPLRRAVPDIDAQATQFWGYAAPRWTRLAVRLLFVAAGVALIWWARTGSGLAP